ncbi:TetR family transcriptional regulator [Planomicrobium soli]|uniref:TetR family transcriptional regulator n=2 Tax=Planomicrobium soli TaxID=1176648 RepID=A0A2P8H2A9_9BACL|nr:TetR family transcriptional regulator [Planomicrobium soli]
MKAELMKKSTDLFVERGFSATSIQDIVDALGVTKGSFYYHFKSKEALLMDIHLRYIDDLLKRQQDLLATEPTNRGKLVKVVELLIHDIENQGAIGQVYYREIRHLSAENAATIRAKRGEFRENIEQVIGDGINSGEFRNNLQPKMITFAILGVTNWSYQWFNPEGTLSVAELADMYTDFILNGILAHEH